MTIFCVLIDNTIVTIELNASGIAATANATAIIKESSKDCFAKKRFRHNTMTQIIIIPIDNLPLNSSKLFCSGVFRSFASFNREAIFPISVCIPMLVTI